MLYLLISLISFGYSSPTPFEITEKSIEFTYTDFDGSIYIECSHRHLKDLDWEVKCADQTYFKKFNVHLGLREIKRPEHPTRPHYSVEVMYWVTSPETKPGKKPDSAGVTLWYHLEKMSPLVALSASMSVEEDSALLFVRLNPEMFR